MRQAHHNQKKKRFTSLLTSAAFVTLNAFPFHANRFHFVLTSGRLTFQLTCTPPVRLAVK
jgi:hypothetical protein